MSGYCGQLLRVNLTSGQIAAEPIDLALARKFVGGRGLGTYYLMKEVDPKVDPLSPDNKLILATGPLTGSSAPTSGRYMAITKSPLTGAVACSNSGGFWGPELKFAGYDMLIVEGKAPKPCTIAIRDSEVKIHDATEYWGKLVSETNQGLTEAFGDPKARVLAIGPAGERMSPIAAILNDKARAAGRSGVGGVMGSKNLKAVVVRGTGKVEPADPAAAKDVMKAKLAKIKQHPITSEGLPALGTASLVNVINESGIYPTDNFQTGVFHEADQVSGETMAEKYLIGKDACYRCPIGCGRRTKTEYMESYGPEFETLWAFSADCGVSDMSAVIQANHLCNEYGLDTISAGSTIACAMELFQKGILPAEDVDGPDLTFGSGAAIVEWTRKMGAGEGLGAKMAMGSYRFAAAYGAPELSMSVKKQELPAYDPRGAQGHGLAYATSNRGGCHVRAYLISPEILGMPEKLDPFSLEGKAALAKGMQDFTAVIDSLGLCLFTSFPLDADDYRDLFNVIVGETCTTEDLATAGERIWNIERAFNLAAGVDSSQDTLPKRLLTEAMPEGAAKGQVHRLPELLPQYYKERGWSENGVPTPEKLAQLGLA